ncbi:MAG: hypothetical protein HFH93_11525 [Lachnospiraceae bacterium]|nr:hypothetical protein [Lachnospiraceae bacterium]
MEGDLYGKHFKRAEKKILDFFGRLVILNVHDRVLKISIDIAQWKTPNPIKIKKYAELEGLTSLQRNAVCDLLLETVADTIYCFLKMFEDYSSEMKILVKFDGKEFDLSQISEVMGSEIARLDEEGWIQKFSEMGRLVL